MLLIILSILSMHSIPSMLSILSIRRRKKGTVGLFAEEIIQLSANANAEFCTGALAQIADAVKGEGKKVRSDNLLRKIFA